MRAKLVVFPIKGRNWCFTRSVDPSIMTRLQSPNTPSTFKQLYERIFSSSHKNQNSAQESKLEVIVDFAANKMNDAWSKLEKAPQGTIMNKIHGLGLKLLSGVKPSEILFKSIPKETDRVDIIYPSSLNSRLVRRRIRHIALRGSVIHKKYFYVSAILLPLTSFFMVLPLPNVPFFWILFRTYSHWRASQGSEKLLYLVSDQSCNPYRSMEKAKKSDDDDLPWALQPSEELQNLLKDTEADEGVCKCTIAKICKKFHLNTADVVKYRNSM